jgi:hypothetical protein
LQGGWVDALALDIERGERRYRLAAPHDANRLAGRGSRDQFAQMRPRLGEIDLLVTVAGP